MQAWDGNTSYTIGQFVFHDGDVFCALQDVPAEYGIEPSRELYLDYWKLWGTAWVPPAGGGGTPWHQGDPGVLAALINNNPAFLKGLITNLAPAPAADIFNFPGTGQFLTSLIGQLDPTPLAAIFNSNGAWCSNFLAALSPQMLASVVNANGAWMASLLGALHAAGAENSLATAINQNPTFFASLLMNLNGVVMGGVISQNPTFFSDLLASIDPVVVAAMINGHPAYLSSIVGNLAPQVIADVMAAPASREFLRFVLLTINPTTVANFINTDPEWWTTFFSTLMGGQVFKGADGQDSTVPGPQGPPGLQGPPGSGEWHWHGEMIAEGTGEGKERKMSVCPMFSTETKVEECSWF